MRTFKLVIGIISILLALIVLFQSCAAGVGSALDGGGDDSGAVGAFVAFFMIIGGIVAIAARSSKGGAIAGTILYLIPGIAGVSATGIFEDLIIWGSLCLICALIFAISIVVQEYEPATIRNDIPDGFLRSKNEFGGVGGTTNSHKEDNDINQIERLFSLKTKGIITEEEYLSKKKEILDS